MDSRSVSEKVGLGYKLLAACDFQEAKKTFEEALALCKG